MIDFFELIDWSQFKEMLRVLLPSGLLVGLGLGLLFYLIGLPIKFGLKIFRDCGEEV